jgi:hypothetical protein
MTVFEMGTGDVPPCRKLIDPTPIDAIIGVLQEFIPRTASGHRPGWF